jgi:CheY-like chemotaxis protein
VKESRAQVVVIDDSEVVLEHVRATLAGAGHDVRVTSEPLGATKLVKGADLVIVDFHMPGIDGGSLLPMLRRALAPADLCLFYLYTSDADVAKRYEQFGFDGGFLRKGDDGALLAQVEAALRTVRMKKLALELRTKRRASKPG